MKISLRRLNTFLIALFFTIPAVNMSITSKYPSLTGKLMTLLYAISFVGVFIVMLVYSINGRRQRISYGTVYLLFIIVFAYVMTLLFGPKMSVSPQMFILLTIFPLIIPHTGAIQTKSLLFWSMVLAAPAAVFTNNIFITSGAHNTIEMGTAYAYLFSIMATILYFLFFFKDDKGLKRICSIVIGLANVLVFLNILQFGARGPIISIACLVVFLCCFSYDNINSRVHLVKGKMLVVLAIGIVILFNIWAIMEYAVEVLNGLDVQINILNKMLRLHRQNNIMNGRDVNVEMALIGIMRSPVIGNGLASYEHYTGYVYPHNLFLQLMYDGGIVLTLLVLIPVVRGCAKWYRHCDIDSYLFVILLLFAGVLPSLFSGEIWTSELVWACFAVLVAQGEKTKKEM